jgi:hypothetical protein
MWIAPPHLQKNKGGEYQSETIITITTTSNKRNKEQQNHGSNKVLE